VFTIFSAFSTLITYTLIIAITLETEVNIFFTLANDLVDISIDIEDTQSQLELLEYDEYSIYYSSKIYKRGKVRPAKRRDKSLNIWYWNYGEEISEDGRKR